MGQPQYVFEKLKVEKLEKLGKISLNYLQRAFEGAVRILQDSVQWDNHSRTCLRMIVTFGQPKYVFENDRDFWATKVRV
jgi:hypothetical protein